MLSSIIIMSYILSMNNITSEINICQDADSTLTGSYTMSAGSVYSSVDGLLVTACNAGVY